MLTGTHLSRLDFPEEPTDCSLEVEQVLFARLQAQLCEARTEYTPTRFAQKDSL